MMLPTAWPRHSRVVEPRVSVIWSTRSSVSKLSTRPTIAKRIAVEMTLPHCPPVKSTPLGGKFHAGKESRPPLKVFEPAMSLSVLLGNAESMQHPNMTDTMIAINGAGHHLPILGILGKITAVIIETA